MTSRWKITNIHLIYALAIRKRNFSIKFFTFCIRHIYNGNWILRHDTWPKKWSSLTNCILYELYNLYSVCTKKRSHITNKRHFHEHYYIRRKIKVENRSYRIIVFVPFCQVFKRENVGKTFIMNITNVELHNIKSFKKS